MSHARRHTLARNARPEDGFGLLELVVVVAIILVLLAISFNSVRGARNVGQGRVAISTAQAYANAVDQFARQHAGRYPAKSPSADWPGGAEQARGPVADVLGTKKYYLRATPESVQDGRVILAGAATEAAAAIDYELDDRGYRFIVYVPGEQPCAVRGGAAKSTTPKDCSTR